MIRVEGHSALACVELEEGQESFNNDIPWDDVRDAVVTESPEYQNAAQTNNVCQSGPWEAQHKVQPVPVFRQREGRHVNVCRQRMSGGGSVASHGTDGLDVYAMMNGKIVDLRSTLVLWSH